MGQKINMTLEESDRQVILLAIAELDLSRPGWNHYLGEVADKFEGREMFDGFKVTSGDRIKPNDLHRAAVAALHALRSYQYGNSARDLAVETADDLEAALRPPGSTKPVRFEA
jgi:hypothetical protein